MDSLMDNLVEIDVEDLQKLKTIFSSNDCNRSFLAYMTIDNHIRWFQHNPDIKFVRFFCLNGDFTDGTFVVAVSIRFYGNYFIITTLNG